MNADRLNKLADFLDSLDPRLFDLRYWGFTKDEAAENECGTVACALGWAPTVFPGEGLTLKVEDGPNGMGRVEYRHLDVGEPRTGFEAGAAFFDLEYREAEYLFDTEDYPTDGSLISPQEVAERIREMIEAGGIPKRRYLVTVAVPVTEYVTYEVEAADDDEARDNWHRGEIVESDLQHDGYGDPEVVEVEES